MKYLFTYSDREKFDPERIAALYDKGKRIRWELLIREFFDPKLSRYIAKKLMLIAFSEEHICKDAVKYTNAAAIFHLTALAMDEEIRKNNIIPLKRNDGFSHNEDAHYEPVHSSANDDEPDAYDKTVMRLEAEALEDYEKNVFHGISDEHECVCSDDMNFSDLMEDEYDPAYCYNRDTEDEYYEELERKRKEDEEYFEELERQEEYFEEEERKRQIVDIQHTYLYPHDPYENESIDNFEHRAKNYDYSMRDD